MKILMRSIVAVYFFLALACIRASESESKETVRLLVNHYRVPCVGSSPQLCYLTRDVTQSTWEYLFEGIEGFEYKWGKIYELEVEKTRRKDVMADQSPVSYKLVEVVNAKDAPADESFALIVKDADMVAIRKADDGTLLMLGQYPVSCSTAPLCQELELRLKSNGTITGIFQHSPDHSSLVLQSIKD